jgi:hypothetical protein
MRNLILTFFILALTSCASSVNVDYDKNVNFLLLKTYQVDLAAARVAADPRVDSSFMQQRVVSALKTTLKKKGYESLKSKPDLRVKYYLDIKKEVESMDSGISIGFGSSSHHSAIGFGFTFPIDDISSVDKLVLTIDVLSSKTGTLIWRGSLADYLYDGATAKSNNELVKKLVTEILENFPPK